MKQSDSTRSLFLGASEDPQSSSEQPWIVVDHLTQRTPDSCPALTGHYRDSGDFDIDLWAKEPSRGHWMAGISLTMNSGHQLYQVHLCILVRLPGKRTIHSHLVMSLTCKSDWKSSQSFLYASFKIFPPLSLSLPSEISPLC